MIHTLCDALAPGGYLAIVHSTRDDAPPEVLERMQQLGASADLRTKLRSRAEVLRFFDGLELVEPGLVHIPLWWPDGPDDIFLDFPGRSVGWACVGRKP